MFKGFVDNIVVSRGISGRKVLDDFQHFFGRDKVRRKGLDIFISTIVSFLIR